MKSARKFSWNPDEYKKLVEQMPHPLLREHVEAEFEYLLSVPKLNESTIVDVGAGYGRIVPILAKRVKRFLAVELDENMLKDLLLVSNGYSNVEIVAGDGNVLTDLLEGRDIINPFVISVQNSLGPWVGDWTAAVQQMRKFAEHLRGDVLVSIWRQEGMKKFAADIYDSLAGLLGEPDLEGSDFEKGKYISKTGYESHWFTASERQEIETMIEGTKVKEITYPLFWILHVSYKSA